MEITKEKFEDYLMCQHLGFYNMIFFDDYKKCWINKAYT